MKGTIQEKAMALAGILQAAELVNEIARYGRYSREAFEISLESVYLLEADSVKAVYGGDVSGLTVGLSALEKLLTQEKSFFQRNTLSYLFGMFYLSRKLLKSASLQTSLRQQLSKLQAQRAYFQDPVHPTLVQNLAEAYSDLFQRFQFKIVIQGSAEVLSQTDNLFKIRALLLAGIRSAVLWKQMGGSRWQFLFQRKQYLQATHDLLEAI